MVRTRVWRCVCEFSVQPYPITITGREKMSEVHRVKKVSEGQRSIVALGRGRKLSSREALSQSTQSEHNPPPKTQDARTVTKTRCRAHILVPVPATCRVAGLQTLYGT